MAPEPRRSEASPLVGMVVVSAVVHLGVLLAVRLTPPEPRVSRPAEAWVEISTVAPEPERVLPEPSPVRPPQEKRKSTKPSAAAPRASGTREAPPANGALVSDTPLATSESGPPVATQGAPTKPNLAPGIGVVMRMGEAADAEDTRGTTLRNDPRDLPDQQAVAEYEAEKANRQLQLDLASDVARVQQASGNLPRYFSNFRRALEDASDAAKPKLEADSQRRQVLNVLGAAADPTRSKPSDEAIKRVSDTAFVQNQRIGNPSLPGDQQQFNQAVAQMFTATERIREQATSAQLRTVISLTTDARGFLADASIEERSGDRTFDESALHLSRKVARDLPDTDDKALGSTWWRSRWVFTWEPPRMRVRFLEATPIRGAMQ